MEDEKEVWKTYLDYPFVEVSNLGRVRTKDRYVPSKNGSKRLVKGQVLKQYLKRNGYMQVCISVNGKRVYLLVHRMVATCFLPNPDNLPEVNHKDNDRTNNSVDNLEWCSHEYNDTYREKYGIALYRPVIAINLETLETFWFDSQHEAQRQLNISRRSIYRVIRGLRSVVHGFWFCNADENAVEKVRAKFGNEVAKKVEELMSES